VNGRRFGVRENCWHALLQCRQRRIQTHIWIDSICIDQTNVAEKSAQVAMMASVFAQVSRVLHGILWKASLKFVSGPLLKSSAKISTCRSDYHSPAPIILQRLRFSKRLPVSSAFHSPAPTILQRLPVSSAYHSPTTAIL